MYIKRRSFIIRFTWQILAVLKSSRYNQEPLPKILIYLVSFWEVDRTENFSTSTSSFFILLFLFLRGDKGTSKTRYQTRYQISVFGHSVRFCEIDQAGNFSVQLLMLRNLFEELSSL